MLLIVTYFPLLFIMETFSLLLVWCGRNDILLDLQYVVFTWKLGRIGKIGRIEDLLPLADQLPPSVPVLHTFLFHIN